MTDYTRSLHRASVYRDALLKWGAPTQTAKAIEELAELITVLSRIGTEREDRDALVDEIADAVIVCEQKAMTHDEAMYGDVFVRIAAKVARLKERVESG